MRRDTAASESLGRSSHVALIQAVSALHSETTHTLSFNKRAKPRVDVFPGKDIARFMCRDWLPN